MLDTNVSDAVSIKEGKKLENMEKQLRKEFATFQYREGKELRQLEKKYEPITNVLKEAKLQEVSKEMIPFKPLMMSTLESQKKYWTDEYEPEDEHYLF